MPTIRDSVPTAATAATSLASGSSSVADTCERLMARFAGQVGLAQISDVVMRCRQDLAGSPLGALPELIERLANQRLLDLVGARQRTASEL